ncbi:MAG: tRNA (adenosine(37)-N6)-threonylcarbamoyltransferase complex transferase subunit TsaD [Bacteroidales bacterium]
MRKKKVLKNITILAIESSCDDTSAAVICDGYVLSSLISVQDIHISYGGVVPELASRAHQANIIPVVDQAIKESGINMEDISGIAFTRGPGLMGSLLVGTSFAKGFALARNIPMIEVNHLHAHILAHFIKKKDGENRLPSFPFLCLLVSGGHTLITVARDYHKMEIIGNTIDDAAGEAFDKCGKIMDLSYPSGPVIDKMAVGGNKDAFRFSRPSVPGLDFSFSGLKTNFLYFIRDRIRENPGFITENIQDLCASLQYTIVSILMDKLIKAADITGIKEIGIAGGVSANSGLRETLENEGRKKGWNVFIPELNYTTDNAAMVGIAGYYKYLKGDFATHDVTPAARYGI